MRMLLYIFLFTCSLAASVIAATLIEEHSFQQNDDRPNDKIQVVEFFSYACSHCFELESSISAWESNIPNDIDFKRIPAMFGGKWDALGQLFFTIQALDVPKNTHLKVFTALQKQRVNTPEEMAKLLEEFGVTPKVFLETYHSFSVAKNVKAAQDATRRYYVSAVPVIIVGEQHRILLSASGGEKMLASVDKLISKLRAKTIGLLM